MQRFILFLLFLSFLLSQCASPLPPVGGGKDETPPQIDTAKSTPNLQTNFQKQRIELAFDEWVVLEDVFNQVVISPPLEYNYEVTLRGKTLRFDFAPEEELRPEATYTINFGEAVKDLNEKNPAEDLRFVFSTGPFLDSLQLAGQVVDAFTEEPIEGAVFMLYENQADTVVRTERPFYFARTNKDGRFRIENVKAGVFKGFALEDANFNYLFDQATERIGFPDSLITMSTDTSSRIQVQLFEEEAPLRLQDSEQRYGLVKMFFNKKPIDYELSYPDLGQQVVEEFDKDTLKFWYHMPEAQPWRIIVRKDTFLQDTIQVETEGRPDFLAEAKLTALNLKGGTTVTKINPTRSLPINFNLPIDSVSRTDIRLFEDTLRTEIPFTLTKDSLNPRVVELGARWKEKVEYEVIFYPGSVASIYGITNADTIAQRLKVEELKRFGNIILKVDSLDATASYVLELLEKKKVVATIPIRQQASFERTFTAFAPGEYTVRIITDDNGNGRWDPGNYDERRQPEKVYRRKLDALRANWDLEVTIDDVNIQ
jgi:hypothetical protein